jgi:hypothetical protein
MTHMPPQFRTPAVLIDEWRRRAAEYRLSDNAAAEVYERCANELQELDVHTEGAPAGAYTRSSTPAQVQMFRLAAGLVAGGLFVAGLTAARTPRIMAD